MGPDARAFWLREPGVGEIRPEPLPEPGPDDVVVRTVRSGISRGTETLVFRGGVPSSQYAVMRAPFQDGDFPGPVKYGYLNVGVVEHGPPRLQGRTVFCLYPHQTAYVVPARSVVVVPDDVPPERAVLAGTVETAVNALWDAGAARRRPGHGGRGRHGGLLCCAAARPVPRRARDARRRRRSDGPASLQRSGSTSRCQPMQPAAAIWSCTRVRRRPGCSVRWTSSPPRARSSTSAGTATSTSRCRSAARSTPSDSASGRVRSGPSRRLAAAPGRPPTGWRSHSTCCAMPPSTLSSPERRRFDELPDVMARLAAGSLPALCHIITYGEG